MGGTLVTIAKDVKLQVEFNPKHVGAYRLIGYENRVMAAQDFNDDTKDAGEIGAGHTVTALYELIPPGKAVPRRDRPAEVSDPPAATADAEVSDELLTVRSASRPRGGQILAALFPVKDATVAFTAASEATRFAAAVAAFGMLLRDSKFKGAATAEQVLAWAQAAKGSDAEGYRADFLTLVKKAAPLLVAAKSAPPPWSTDPTQRVDFYLPRGRLLPPKGSTSTSQRADCYLPKGRRYLPWGSTSTSQRVDCYLPKGPTSTSQRVDFYLPKVDFYLPKGRLLPPKGSTAGSLLVPSWLHSSTRRRSYEEHRSHPCRGHSSTLGLSFPFLDIPFPPWILAPEDKRRAHVRHRPRWSFHMKS
jgi:hypothetical protein